LRRRVPPRETSVQATFEVNSDGGLHLRRRTIVRDRTIVLCLDGAIRIRYGSLILQHLDVSDLMKLNTASSQDTDVLDGSDRAVV
jgi:hypothetical protein